VDRFQRHTVEKRQLLKKNSRNAARNPKNVIKNSREYEKYLIFQKLSRLASTHGQKLPNILADMVGKRESIIFFNLNCNNSTKGLKEEFETATFMEEHFLTCFQKGKIPNVNGAMRQD
jgi:hypothetical protein